MNSGLVRIHDLLNRKHWLTVNARLQEIVELMNEDLAPLRVGLVENEHRNFEINLEGHDYTIAVVSPGTKFPVRIDAPKTSQVMVCSSDDMIAHGIADILEAQLDRLFAFQKGTA